MEYQKDLVGMDLSPEEVLGFPSGTARGDIVIHPDNGHVCGCGVSSHGTVGGWGLNGHPLAMVYAPYQAFRGLYDPDTALSRGTLFAELDLPLEVGYAQGRNNGCGCGCNEKRRG